MILKHLIIQQLLQLPATNAANENAFGEKKLIFKSNAPFVNCVSKINGIKIDNAI